MRRLSKREIIIRKLQQKAEEREEKEGVVIPEREVQLRPKDIKLKGAAFSLSFHPKINNLVAASLINGVQIYEYEDLKKSKLVFNKKGKSTRGIIYSEDGNELYTCSEKNISIINIEDGKTIHQFTEAHNQTVNKIAIYDGLIVSGCDAGLIRVWDIRQKRRVTTFQEHTDFISDFLTVPKKNTIVATRFLHSKYYL